MKKGSSRSTFHPLSADRYGIASWGEPRAAWCRMSRVSKEVALHSFAYRRVNRISFLLTGLLAALAGCHGSGSTEQTREVKYGLPTITPQAETKQSQEKGGIEISVAPVSYTVDREEKYTYTPSRPSGVAAVIGPQNDQPRIYVDWIKETAVTVAPDRVTFLVKINNKLPRVFRGAGTVVQFNVGGKLQAVSQEGYEPLTNIIVPPRTEQQVEISGPLVSSLSGTNPLIGLFFYDVVTKINDAGVVTEKQNYEWYFTYTLEPKTEDAPYSSGSGYMPVAQYQEWKMKQAPRRVRVKRSEVQQ